MNDDICKRVMQLNEESGFLAHNGIRVVSVSETECVLEAIITDSSKNIFGLVHGGLIYTMADTAAGALARAKHLGRNVTLNTFVSYLNAAKNTRRLVAIGREKRVGKSIGVYDVIVTDEQETPVAMATVTMRFFLRNL